MFRKKTKQKSALLMYAAPEEDADMFYFGNFFAPDPFFALQVGRKKYALVNALEYGRACKESTFDTVLSFEEWKEKACRHFKSKIVSLTQIIEVLALELNINLLKVPKNFPSGLAFDLLKSKNVEIEIAADPLFPKRVLKSEQELEFIKQGNQASAHGIQVAKKLIANASIKNGKLYHDGKVLTSEFVKEKIAIACIEKGAIAKGTIVAGGDQACDPHDQGSGPLFANELIIVDVFPRVEKTGYHGDMTRTFLKGKASEAQKALVANVKKAQDVALETVKAGVKGHTVHKAVMDTFIEAGYETGKDGEGYKGFFHGTGHGLGLDIHEAPRVSLNSGALKENSVVTIEPGLYYKGLGGVRIEDVVAVEKDGYKMLSKSPYKWNWS